MTKRDGNTSEVRKINCWTARNSRYSTKHDQVCVGGKAIKWLMITQIIKGKDGILFMNPIDILEECIRLMMITTHLSRDFMKMQSISDDNKSKE